MAEGPLLLEAFYALVDKAPDRVQFTQPTGGGQVRDYTRKEILDSAMRMAAHLKAQNFEPGSRIGMLSKNCAEFIIAELAIWMAGHVTVAIFPTASADTVSFIIEHAECKLVFVGKLDTWGNLEKAVPADLPKVAFPLAPKTDLPKWNDILASTEPLPERASRDADDMAIIIYTSGSTGQPKGVMHNFGRMSAASHGIVRELKITENDRGLSYLPLAHVFERAYIECANLIGGGRLFFAESLDTFVVDLRRAHPTLFISVPRLWLKFQLGVFKNMPPKKLDLFLKIPILSGIVKKKVLTGLGLDNVRLAGSGSAPIPAELIAWYRRLGLNLLEGYAMSEDFAYSHLSTPEYSEPGYVGVPYPGVDVKISDAGEILIKSLGTMMGYYKLPELTAESFTEDGYFKTGDRGERKPSGMLKITGRVKEIFKTSKGKYVSPAPIENLINNDPHVELSCVSGSGFPQPYSLIVLGEDIRPKQGDAAFQAETTPKLEALLADVNSKVEHHERLECFVIVSDAWEVENGFLTPTLKIRRSAIEDAYESKLEGWYDAKKKVIWA
ncbi:MAG: AMP-binding protein [Deltaproteobacteria bacterium]|nr:AMP-binding protein [Deltaproteobacteria bacterium]